jgi:glycosyltransferase involved in cell wall biosynthesis
MTPRILFVTHTSRSGAPLMLLHFLRWLRDQGDVEFAILAREGELLAEFAELAPTTCIDPTDANVVSRLVRRIGSADRAIAPPLEGVGTIEGAVRGAARRAMLRDLKRRAPTESVDLVYLNSITAASVLPLIPMGIPVLTHVHEMGHGIRMIRHQEPNAIADMLARTDRYIAASRRTAEDLTLELEVPSTRIDVCHEFISIDESQPDPVQAARFRQSLGIGRESLIVGAVGRIEWRKGADLFIQVARRTLELLGPGRNVVFVWAGPASEFRWQEYVDHDTRALGLEEHVRFVGPVRDAASVVGAFDLFVLTSRSDPFPLVCLEAAAMGKPIICFDAGGMGEFLEPADELLIPYLDTDAMARRVVSLLGSRKEARALGARLRRRVRERHRTKSAAPRLLGLIRNAIDAGPRP